MRKWAVNYFDGVYDLYRCVYACSCGFTVVDKFDLDSDDEDVIYQGIDREKVVSLMEATGNVMQSVIDMIRAYPLNIKKGV